ncbi:hypothetical protein Psta_1713 [Pirellula staleyi DSM 6068]|uniref:Uncharacterized protein n=1 Tax=Pirellula staleyi (strain ATCC 27377 / DSM 6068 / ICPB 4128) TaxID=530564 RepID=D2QYT3_PIRSD|nr:hypothetical protein [Pirellula staleyi]ADB16388.1 hypothetical protein Psta_1713 [Pirellula staleyi DSM 6068]
MRLLKSRFWRGTGLGLCLGLCLGLAVAAGVLLERGAPASAETHESIASRFAEMKLHASATHGAETFAVATGAVDEEAEGVFFLDYLTGDLQCFVMNPRVGKFTGWFKTNIVNDLPVEKGKKPTYVMATGLWNVRGGNQRPAQCVVYVADANSGIFVAYSFPWVRGTTSTLTAQAAPMLRLDGGKARNLEIRE